MRRLWWRLLCQGQGRRAAGRERTVRDHVLQHFHRIVADDAQVGDARLLGGAKAGAHTRRVHPMPMKFFSGRSWPSPPGEAPAAEPDLQHHGCLAAKQGHHVERLWCEIDAHDRPELFQGLLLPFGQAAFATDEAADLAHELAVFVKHILGHRHSKLLVIASLWNRADINGSLVIASVRKNRGANYPKIGTRRKCFPQQIPGTAHFHRQG